ncbi:phosphatase PAP2 family protein [Streptomyces sp. SBST2-5]|uniref:Phosphatase PAP2 family protein n=2 Tax=Streptomyces composti TaxID=2720025 RepID=A0ABX1AFY4_9ACTN|nr:phosphatase PAP2 family protein [Streptomyces composti]NJP53827.1 phosphatase PAP2 family protein [Streptomyces composti]
MTHVLKSLSRAGESVRATAPQSAARGGRRTGSAARPARRRGDTAWQPLGPTPCFPAWASGHADFAGAWQTVMTDVFNTDQITFTATTDDPRSPVRNRTFNRFSDAAEEDALSRLYLGVHYRWDAVDGLRLGRDVGSYVVGHELRRL